MKSVVKKEIRPHSFAAWMAFMRPKTFWIAAAPVCVGTAFAGALAGTWNLWIFLFTLLGAVSIQAMSNMVSDYVLQPYKKAENGTRRYVFAESYDRRLDLYVRSKENGRLFYCCLLPVRYSLDRHWRPSDRLYCSTFAYLRLLLYGRPETYRLHAFRRIFSFSFLRSFRSQRNLLASNA